MAAAAVTVRVLREHSGDKGFQPEGTEYETDRATARDLANRNLVEIVEAEEAQAEPAQDDAGAPATTSKGGKTATDEA